MIFVFKCKKNRKNLIVSVVKLGKFQYFLSLNMD